MFVNNFTKFENDFEKSPLIKIVVIFVSFLLGCCMCQLNLYRLKYRYNS